VCVVSRCYSRGKDRVKEKRRLLDEQREQIRQQWVADNQRSMQQLLMESQHSNHQLMLAEQET